MKFVSVNTALKDFHDGVEDCTVLQCFYEPNLDALVSESVIYLHYAVVSEDTYFRTYHDDPDLATNTMYHRVINAMNYIKARHLPFAMSMWGFRYSYRDSLGVRRIVETDIFGDKSIRRALLDINKEVCTIYKNGGALTHAYHLNLIRFVVIGTDTTTFSSLLEGRDCPILSGITYTDMDINDIVDATSIMN